MSRFQVNDKRPDPFLRVDSAAHQLIVQHLDVHALAVYLGLIHHANKVGQAWMMLTSLATTSGVKLSTLKTRLPDLEGIGLIRIQNTYDAEGQSSNVYTLLETPAEVPADWRSRPRPVRGPFAREIHNGVVSFRWIGRGEEPPAGFTETPQSSHALATPRPPAGSTAATSWPLTRVKELEEENQTRVPAKDKQPANLHELTTAELRRLDTIAARLELADRGAATREDLPALSGADQRAIDDDTAKRYELARSAAR